MMTTKDLQEKLNLVINRAKPDLTVAQITTVMNTLVTALGTDTTTTTNAAPYANSYGGLIQAPPAALYPNLGR